MKKPASCWAGGLMIVCFGGTKPKPSRFIPLLSQNCNRFRSCVVNTDQTGAPEDLAQLVICPALKRPEGTPDLGNVTGNR